MRSYRIRPGPGHAKVKPPVEHLDSTLDHSSFLPNQTKEGDKLRWSPCAIDLPPIAEDEKEWDLAKPNNSDLPPKPKTLTLGLYEAKNRNEQIIQDGAVRK